VAGPSFLGDAANAARSVYLFQPAPSLRSRKGTRSGHLPPWSMFRRAEQLNQRSFCAVSFLALPVFFVPDDRFFYTSNCIRPLRNSRQMRHTICSGSRSARSGTDAEPRPYRSLQAMSARTHAQVRFWKIKSRHARTGSIRVVTPRPARHTLRGAMVITANPTRRPAGRVYSPNPLYRIFPSNRVNPSATAAPQQDAAPRSTPTTHITSRNRVRCAGRPSAMRSPVRLCPAKPHPISPYSPMTA